MSRSISKFFLALLIVAGVASVSKAQDDNVIRPNTKSGSAAWVFGINGLGNFGVGGMDIGNNSSSPVLAAGYKGYIADDMALRIMLGFMSTSGGDKDKPVNSVGATSSLDLGIGVGVEFHTKPVYSISPYFGGQITYGMHSMTNTVGSNEGKESSGQFGIAALAGFDWYFVRGIFIGAEYNLGFYSRSSSSQPVGGTSADAPSSTSIGIGSGSVHLGVHF